MTTAQEGEKSSSTAPKHRPTDASSACYLDWNALYEHPHVSPALLAAARAAKTRLPPLIAEQQQKEQAEVMGKLKDLGNTVLGEEIFQSPAEMNSGLD